jgi:surface antigen
MSQNLSSNITDIAKQKKVSKKNQKRIIRWGILTANIVLLIAVLGFVLRSPDASTTINTNVVDTNSATESSRALDQVSSADIAVHVARITSLPEAAAVTNNADTVNAQLAVSAADDTVVAKPQVVSTALKSYKDIISYTTVEGDTIPSLAAKFGITSDTIRWSNGLSGDTVVAGKTLLISPVNGVVYTVKSGDTVDSLAAKFRANKDQIIADNDAESGALVVGRNILIRDGTVAAAVARVSFSSGGGFAWGSSAIYGYNGYDYGYCTWYVANRRAQSGNPVPANLGNARTWLGISRGVGIPTGNVPRAGAVIWTPPRDYYGHVGFVESVNSDGSVNVSEMNVAGFAVRSTKTLSPAAAASYSYIY